MKAKPITRLLGAALAVIMLVPVAASAEDDSYNPFDNTTVPAVQASGTDLFGVTDATGTVPSTNAANFATASPVNSGSTNPFDTGAPSGGADPDYNPNGAANMDGGDNGTAVDLFNLGTPTPAPTAVPANQGANPFGTSPNPATIPGYNPFDPSTGTSTDVIPTNMVMFVSAASLKIRREAKEYSRVLATVTFGQQLTVTATSGDWAQVQSPNGGSGFCEITGLSAADPNTMSKQVYAQLQRVPVYNTPSRKSRRMRTMNQGDTITMVAVTSDGMWARVTDGTNYGFVPTVMVDETPASQGTPVWCNEGATPVLVNPDAWIQISTLSFGQNVRLLGYTSNNTMAKVASSKGYVAYCSASALTTADPATMNTPVFAAVSGKCLARSTAEDARKVSMPKNAQMTLLGLDASQYWALVRFRGQKYYVPYIFLAPSRLGQGSRVVVTTQETPLYRTETEVITNLPVGTRLNLTGAANGAAAVTVIADANTQAYAGYVMPNALRAE